MNYNQHKRMDQTLFWIIGICFLAGFFLTFSFGCSTTGGTGEGGVTAAPPSEQPPVNPPVGNLEAREKIMAIGVNSKCAKYYWKDRGVTPKGWNKGMSLVYARALCSPKRADVVISSSARSLPESVHDKKDALSWYNSNFKALGLNSDNSGTLTLRNTYAMIMGLGPRETSGLYCCGRDMTAHYDSADSAEAGAVQASHGSKRVAKAELQAIFDYYSSNHAACYQDVFREGVRKYSSKLGRYMEHDEYCKSQSVNWGNPEEPGYKWQTLMKTCPAAAVEWGSVLVRRTGGTAGEFGPLRRKEVELKSECVDMLREVEVAIHNEPGICGSL